MLRPIAIKDTPNRKSSNAAWLWGTGALWAAVAFLNATFAIAQENPIVESLIPKDQSLNWRLEVRRAPNCVICEPVIQMAVEKNSAKPTQCSLLSPPVPEGFELPAWTEIDYRQNIELLRTAVIETEWSNRHGIGFLRRSMPTAAPDQLRTMFWDRFSKPILTLFEQGSAHLERTDFTIDGKQTTLFRVSQVEPINSDTYEGPWRVTTCDESGSYAAHYVFAADPNLGRVLARYARQWMTILNYRGSTYLWHRAFSSGFVLSLARSNDDMNVTTELYLAYWYSRSK